MPVITYLAGYCCYVVLKKIKCECCKEKLVLTDELVVEDSYSLIKNLTRGGLLYPHDSVVRLVLFSYILFNKLLENFEDEFLNVHNKRAYLCELVVKYITLNGHFPCFDDCTNHTEKNIVNIIINCTINTLLKNYCGKRNDNLGRRNNSKKLCTLATLD